jgi:hypothetical protein
MKIEKITPLCKECYQRVLMQGEDLLAGESSPVLPDSYSVTGIEKIAYLIY